MPEFASFTTPEPVAEEDRFDARQAIGHAILVRPTEHKTGVVTSNNPNGTDALAADILDLDFPGGPKVFKDTLLFTGSLVDGLKKYIGQLVVVRLQMMTSKTGRTYPTPLPGEAGDTERATAYYSQHGDPFAPTFHTVPQTSAKAPF